MTAGEMIRQGSRSADGVSDEQYLRELIARWAVAACSGEVEFLRAFLSPDVLFFPAGYPPMDGEVYLARAAALPSAVRMAIDCEVVEVVVSGDLAVCRQSFRIVFTPLTGGEEALFAGPSLLVFRRNADAAIPVRWLLWRDANLVMPVRS